MTHIPEPRRAVRKHQMTDRARFWRYAVAALGRARPGLAGRVGPLTSRSFEGLVTALINELAADPGPYEVLLVLDDYHLADSGPVHESVAFLLENLPPGLRMVVSGRAEPAGGRLVQPVPSQRARLVLARVLLAQLPAARPRARSTAAARRRQAKPAHRPRPGGGARYG